MSADWTTFGSVTGNRLKVEDESFIVAREDHEAGVKSPLTGVVTAVNNKLLDYPDTTNADPYGGGWVMLIDPMELKHDLEGLCFGVESAKFIEAEAERLLSMITDDPAAAAALGGEPIKDVYGAFKDIGWNDLVKTFI